MNNIDINLKIDKNSLEYDVISLMSKYHKDQKKQEKINKNTEYEKVLAQKEIQREIVNQVKKEFLKGADWKRLCIMLQKEGFIYRCPTCLDVSEHYGKEEVKGIY